VVLTAAVLEAASVADVAAVIEAAGEVERWLDAAPADEVIGGLAAAGDPAGALRALGRLLALADPRPEPGTVERLLRLLGGSPALASALAAEGAQWPAMLSAAFATPVRTAGEHHAALAAIGAAGPLDRKELATALRRHHRRELIRIGGRDLTGLAVVDDTVRELSTLADAEIATAVACARARVAAEWGGDPAVGFTVFGMGKLGGGELNYSSDVDLVYVYERDGAHGGRTLREFFVRIAEEASRALAEVTADGLCFRVDLRLRPGGGEGPLAISLAAAISYYETWGQTWERAVWLKARPVAGDAALGAELLSALEPFVYRRFLDYGTLEDLKSMKRRVDASLRDPTARERNVKLGRGGIREIEFFVQAQQLVHGGKDARLRHRNTLAALDRLAACGHIDPAQGLALADAYRFLRDVEHKLQIVQQRQTQLLPVDPDEVAALARRLGGRGPEALAAFRAAHARHTDVANAAFAALFHRAEETRRREERPELARLIDDLDQEERALWHLANLGFRDLETAYADLRLLRDGPPQAPASSRRRDALSALAPAMVSAIAASAAPDRALHHMATFVSTIGARTSYLHLLLENPGILGLLVRLFAGSEFLSRFFLRHPELLDNLVRADLVRVTRPADDMAAELRGRLAAASDLETRLDELRRFRHEEFLRIGVHDLEGELDVEEASRQLSVLATVCLGAAVDVAREELLARTRLPPTQPTDGLAVLAMGKLGSAELNYNSDLDLIFVYDPGDPAWWVGKMPAHEFFTRVAQRAISALQTPTREGIAYRIDTRLRPSGNQGSLVCSIDAFETYHRTSAAVWERQALIKANPLIGPEALRARLARALDAFVYGRRLERDEVAEIARIREKMAEERGGDGNGQVNIKTGRGGLVDVEFLVQMLQLRHGHDHPAVRKRRTRDALAALESSGLVPAEDARALAAGYAFLRTLENRLRIENDQPVEAMDADVEALLPLARRLGYEGPDDQVVTALRADHNLHSQAIRSAYDRLFAAAAA
jgi:glutamate-ammonia-ligase adenylyltransferase